MFPLLCRYNGVRKGVLSQNSSYSASFCSSHRPRHREFPLFRHLAGGSFSHVMRAAGTAVRFLWTGIAVKKTCAPVFKKAKLSGQAVSQRSNDLHPLCPPHISGSALAPFPGGCFSGRGDMEGNEFKPALAPARAAGPSALDLPANSYPAKHLAPELPNTSRSSCRALLFRSIQCLAPEPPKRPTRFAKHPTPHSPSTPHPSHQTACTRFVKRPAPASPMPYAPLAPRPHSPNTFPSSSPFQKGRRAVHCGDLFSPGKHKIIFF